MTAEHLIQLVQDLERTCIDVWLDSGCGVDALLGEQTRGHHDVDVIVSLSDVPSVLAVLGRRGYALVDGEPPASLVLLDRDGRQVDIHPVATSTSGHTTRPSDA